MINLLPPRYKMEIKEEGGLRMAIILEFLFLVFLVSLMLILFSIKIYLQSQLDSFKNSVAFQEKSSQNSEAQDFKNKVITVNQKIARLDSFYQNQIFSVDILEKISKLIPEGIYLETLTWQKESGQVNINGFSPTRELLFTLNSNLGTEKDFSNIIFSQDSWLDPTDIDFKVNFNINKINSQK